MKLTGKLKEDVEKAENKEQAKELIAEAGMELTDDELDKVAGGFVINIESNQLPNYEYNTVIITRG